MRTPMAPSLTPSAEEEVPQLGLATVELLYTHISDAPSHASDEDPTGSDGYEPLENWSAEADVPSASNGAAAAVNSQPLPGGRVISVNGMDFHVYGNVSGLELLDQAGNHAESLVLDSEDEEEEERKRTEAERAIQEADRADAARRSAPLPPEHCRAIVDAMRGITLGGFSPDWARSLPEEQWLSRVPSRGHYEDGNRLQGST